MKKFLATKPVRNVLAIVAFLALFKIAARGGGALDIREITNSLEVMACVLGVWIAFRLNAIVAAVFAATMAITVGVEFFYHVIFGYTTVQTGPVHMAVLTASLVGLLIGAVLRPRFTAFRSLHREQTQGDQDVNFAPR